MVQVIRQEGQAIVIVYAYIGSWEFDGRMVMQILSDLASYPIIKWRMHSEGGDVIEGNVIYNAIANAPQRNELQIDGLCASMATVISQAFDHISIVENGLFMIHAPSGGAYGNASDLEGAAKVLRIMETQIAAAYARRTGKPETETAQWMDGQDHWLTPQEALEAGLVDAIVPSPIEAPEELSLETAVALGPKAVYTRFAASLEAAAKPEPANSSKMDKQKLIDKYKLTGVTKDTPDEEFQKVLEQHIDGVQQKADDAETSTEETVESMAEAAIKAGKFTAKQKETLVHVGKTSGIKALATFIDAAKPYATLNGQVRETGQQQQQQGEERKGWTWAKYQKEDPKALAKLHKENFEAWADLYEAEYNVRPNA